MFLLLTSVNGSSKFSASRTGELQHEFEVDSTACDVNLGYFYRIVSRGWLGSRAVSVLDSGAEGPGFKSQSRRCRITVLGKLFTPIVPLFTKQQNL